MKTILVLFCLLLGNFCFAGTMVRQSMSVAQAALFLSFASFSESCSVSSNLDIKNPGQKITFSIHTPTSDSDLTLNASDTLSYSYDSATGAQSLSGLGLELQTSNWNTITVVSLAGIRCRPFASP